MPTADDAEITRLMVEAGFSTVFIGIETSDAAALEECQKKQTRNRDIIAAHASDLHLKAGVPPHLRLKSRIRPVKADPLSGDEILDMADFSVCGLNVIATHFMRTA